MQIHCINLPFSKAYLIEDKENLYLVDTGIPHSWRILLKYMRNLGDKKLRLIYITHAHLDHYGNADKLRQITGAPIAIHKNDAISMQLGDTNLGKTKSLGKIIQASMPLVSAIFKTSPTDADILLDDGQSLKEFGIDGSIIYTPGHTVGSSTLLLDSQIAFVGDLILGTHKPHPQNYFAEDWNMIPISIQKLKEIKPEWIYPGHGKCPIQGEWLQTIELKE